MAEKNSSNTSVLLGKRKLPSEAPKEDDKRKPPVTLYNFGYAPKEVIEKFQHFCMNYPTLTAAIENLLKRDEKLNIKYRFISSTVTYQMLARPTVKDDPAAIKAAILKLHKYAKDGRYKSVSDSIEELLMSVHKKCDCANSNSRKTNGVNSVQLAAIDKISEAVYNKLMQAINNQSTAAKNNNATLTRGSSLSSDHGDGLNGVNDDDVVEVPLSSTVAKQSPRTKLYQHQGPNNAAAKGPQTVSMQLATNRMICQRVPTRGVPVGFPVNTLPVRSRPPKALITTSPLSRVVTSKSPGNPGIAHQSVTQKVKQLTTNNDNATSPLSANGVTSSARISRTAANDRASRLAVRAMGGKVQIKNSVSEANKVQLFNRGANSAIMIRPKASDFKSAQKEAATRNKMQNRNEGNLLKCEFTNAAEAVPADPEAGAIELKNQSTEDGKILPLLQPLKSFSSNKKPAEGVEELKEIAEKKTKGTKAQILLDECGLMPSSTVEEYHEKHSFVHAPR